METESNSASSFVESKLSEQVCLKKWLNTGSVNAETQLIAVIMFPSHESNSVSMYAGSNLDSAIGYAMI
jgi:hypothetical protein